MEEEATKLLEWLRNNWEILPKLIMYSFGFGFLVLFINYNYQIPYSFETTVMLSVALSTLTWLSIGYVIGPIIWLFLYVSALFFSKINMKITVSIRATMKQEVSTRAKDVAIQISTFTLILSFIVNRYLRWNFINSLFVFTALFVFFYWVIVILIRVLPPILLFEDKRVVKEWKKGIKKGEKLGRSLSKIGHNR